MRKTGRKSTESGDPEGRQGRGFEGRSAERFSAASAELHAQVQATRAQLDAANEKIKARTGRDLIMAIIIGVGLGGLVMVSLIIDKDLYAPVAVLGLGATAVELANALRHWGLRISRVLIGVLAVAVVLATLFWREEGLLLSTLAALAVTWVWQGVGGLVTGRRPGMILRDWGGSALVLIYVVFLGAVSVLMVHSDGGQWWLFALIIMVVSVDTGAYASGLNFGKHPMAPKISPKKTWEGFAGAVLAAIIAGILLSWLMLGMEWYFGLLLALVVVITATAGDLFESQLKRNMGIKDISDWLPGHGGLLDRLDSILPTIPAVYLLMVLLG